jgi:hypothetical protein
MATFFKTRILQAREVKLSNAVTSIQFFLGYKRRGVHQEKSSGVEVGPNTSTLTLRVLGGDDKEVSNLRDKIWS